MSRIRAAVLFAVLPLFINACGRTGSPQGPAQAKIADYNGVPTLFVDGKPQFTMIMMTPWFQHETTPQGQKKLEAEVKAGITLHSTCDELGLSDFSKFWYGPDQYDFSLLDRKLQAVDSINPQAHIFIKLFVQAPGWMVEAYPEDWVQYASDLQPNRDTIRLSSFDKQGAFLSYASERWRSDVRKMLQAFVAHIDSVPWGRKVIGVNLLNGHAQEWHYWGSIFGMHPDVSPPMVAGFRKWLTVKYGNDTEKLRKAWNDPKVTFESAGIPGLDARVHAAYGYFRDPHKEAPIIDYYRFQHELTADLLIDFCKTVKDASAGRLLTGAYYGYIFHSPWYPDGHSLGMDKVLASNVIDFLAAPPNYNDWLSRGLGGDALLRSLPETIKAAGKLHIVESDEGTYMADRLHRPSEKMDSWDESVANMRKQWAQVMIRGIGQWWWDWEDNHGLYIHERHVQALAEMKKLGDASIHLDRRSNAEVALVYSFESFYYIYSHIGNPTWEMTDAPTHVAARSGFAFDMISINDFNRQDLPEYKLYIFPQAYYVDEGLRGKIKSALSRNNATALWYYAPGLYSENGLSTASMQELTGIRLEQWNKKMTPKVQLTDWENDMLRGFNRERPSINRVRVGKGADDGVDYSDNWTHFTYGQNEGDLEPVFYAKDSDATVLGYIENTDKAGLAVKKAEGYTSIYSAAHISSTELMRAIARQAGVHMYHGEDQVMMVNRHFICLLSRGDREPLKIVLPGKSDVYDCFKREWIAEGVTGFTAQIPPRTTQLFYYGDKQDLIDASNYEME